MIRPAAEDDVEWTMADTGDHHRPSVGRMGVADDLTLRVTSAVKRR